MGIEQIITVVTDTASIAMFDPLALEHRRSDPADWWCAREDAAPEVVRGEILIVHLGGDGSNTVRVTDADLSADERAYASEVAGPYGLRIESGRAIVTAGEMLPGGAPSPSEGGDEWPTEYIITMSRGHYSAEVYSIAWHESARRWCETGPDATNAPPDYVITLRPRSNDTELLRHGVQLAGIGKKWLFPGETRQVGPAAGMVLVSTIRKSPRGLILAPCGPDCYEARLEDYSAVEWKDRIRFRVTDVDHSKHQLVCRLIEKLSG